MKNQLIKLINLSCCSILALNSCATKDVNANIDHVASKIKNIKESAEKTNSIVNHNFITTVPEGIFTSQVTKDRHSTQLPQIFYSTIKVNNTFTGLKSAGDAISDLTGISVDVASADSKRDTATKSVYIYQNSGNLVNLLDKIATKYDVEWTYNDGVIEFNRLQTYTWSINAIPGDYSMQNNITNTVGLNATNANTSSSTGSGSSSSSGGGNSSSQTGTSQGTQTLAFNSSANIWSNISSTVKSMLSSEGSVSVSPADSTLTVNDRPHVVRLVGRYIAKENEIIGRQVKLEVKLLTVSVSDEDNYNINWAAVLHGTTAGAAIASTAGSTLGSSFTINANSGDLSGSSLIINALSEKDKTSVVTDATVITHNNQPVPLQSSTQKSYVSGSQTTLVSNAGSETTVTTGVLTTGFTMNVLPNILANQEVNLQITLNLSTLVSMDSYSAGVESGTSTIQLPSVATKSFMQRVSMHSGQTLVLSGFDEGDNKLSQKGVGSSSWWWFGGGPDNKKTHEILVVLITPQVMETN